MKEKEVYVRISKYGKIHKGILSRDPSLSRGTTVLISCRPWGWGVIPANEFQPKNVRILSDSTLVELNDICKTCLKMEKKGKLTKEYYILKDDDETYGKRYILSKDKPTADEPQLKIAGTINVSGDVDLFEKISHL